MKKNSFKNLTRFIFVGIPSFILFWLFACIPFIVFMLRIVLVGGLFSFVQVELVNGVVFSIFNNKHNIMLIFLNGWLEPDVYYIYYFALYIDYIFWFVDYTNQILCKLFSLVLEITIFKVIVYKIFIPMLFGNYIIFLGSYSYSVNTLLREQSVIITYLYDELYFNYVLGIIFSYWDYYFWGFINHEIDYLLIYKGCLFIYKNPLYLLKIFFKLSKLTLLPLACITALSPIIYIWKIIWVGFTGVFKMSLFTYSFLCCFIVILLYLFLYFSINNTEFFSQSVDYKISNKLLILLKKNFAFNFIFCVNYTYLLVFLCGLIYNYKNISNNLKLTNLHYSENLYNDMFSNISIFFVVLFFMLFIKIVNNFLLHDERVSLSVVLSLFFSLLYIYLMLISADLFLTYLSITGLSLSLYVLIFFDKKSIGGLEAVSKYYFLGAAASGIFLFGSSLFYKEVGSFNYHKIYLDLLEIKSLGVCINLNYNLIIGIIFIILGFSFKLSIVPFHGWTPDVYLGSPTITTCLLSTIVKFGVYCTFIRLYYSVLIQILNNDKIFKNFILILAISSIIIGAIGACDQVKIKKFLGYTTINQMGFILLGLAVKNIYGFASSYIYLIIYVILNLIMFSILLGVRYKGRELMYITDLSIFFRNNKHAGLLFVLIIFSLAGLPPTIGFFMKFLIIKALVISGYLKLAVFILYVNVISIFYYVRLIKIILLNSEESINNLINNNTAKNTIEHLEVAWALKNRPLTLDEKNEVNFYLFKDYTDSLKHVDILDLFKDLEGKGLTVSVYTVVLTYSKYFIFYLLAYTFISGIWFNWLIHNKLILNILSDSWLSVNWMFTDYVSSEIYVKMLDIFLTLL